MKRNFFFLSLLLGYFYADAGHITGGDIKYTCLDSSQHIYQIGLTLFRDCIQGQVPFDPSISLFYFDTIQGSLLKIEEIAYSGVSTPIAPIGLGNCAISPPNDCNEFTIYSIIDTLPPRPGGYSIGWSRCCSNSSLVNGNSPQGFTFSAHIPGVETYPKNTQPQFAQKNIYLLCQDEPFVIDLQAADDDGDSLVYMIHPVLSGLNINGLGTSNQQQQAIVGAMNPMGPPPYLAFNWSPGYSATDPLSTGFFHIDPQTAKLYGEAGSPGAHIYSIAVEEFRNGISLGLHTLLLKLNVIDCGNVPLSWDVVTDYGSLSVNQDTVMASDDSAFCFLVNLNPMAAGEQIALQVNAASALAEWNISEISANPLQYEICWTPACRAWPDTLLSLVLESSPDDECPLSGFRLDTVYLQLSASGDTIAGLAPQANFTVSQDGKRLSFQNQSQTAGTYLWDFGDGSTSQLRDPIHTFLAFDFYDIQLIVQNDCGSDTFNQTVSVMLTDLEEAVQSVFSVWPNPIDNYFTVRLPHVKTAADLKLFNLQGQECWGSRQIQIEEMHTISGLKKGIYFLEISQAGQSSVQKLMINP